MALGEQKKPKTSLIMSVLNDNLLGNLNFNINNKNKSITNNFSSKK